MANNWSAVETEILADLRNFATGPEAQKAFAEFAAEKIKEVQDRDQPSSTEVSVNGNQGAALSTVTVPGAVRAEFSYLREVVAEIFNMLIQTSPYAPKPASAAIQDLYKDEHLIFVDGVQTDDITNLHADAEVIFVNTLPYARKIERGLSLEAPNGVYEMVARLMKRKYGQAVDIQFNWVGVMGVLASWHSAKASKSVGAESKKKANQSANRYPAITVSTRSLI